jgi:hypothetical protein
MRHLALILLLSGCALTDVSVGEDIRAKAVPELEPGVSTMADVVRDVGPPHEVAHLRYGSVFVYRLTEEVGESLNISLVLAEFGYAGEDRRPGVMLVQFDRKGTLDTLAFRESWAP